MSSGLHDHYSELFIKGSTPSELAYEIYKSHDLKLIYDLRTLSYDIIFDLILLRFKDNMCSWHSINSVSVRVIGVSSGTTGDKAL